MSRARSLRRLERRGPGASVDTLYKRASYKNRKGRAAVRRLSALIKENARLSRIFG